MSGVEGGSIVIDGEGVNVGDGVLGYGVTDGGERRVPRQDTNPTDNASQTPHRNRGKNKESFAIIFYGKTTGKGIVMENTSVMDGKVYLYSGDQPKFREIQEFLWSDSIEAAQFEEVDDSIRRCKKAFITA